MRKLPPIEPIAGVVLLVLILTAPYLDEIYFGSSDDGLGPTSIEWRITTFNETWRIRIDEIQAIDPANVSFAIIGPFDCLPKIDDPSGFPVPLMGDLDDILFVRSAYDNANVTNGTYFHSRDPDGLRNRNITLFMVYVDVDEDGALSSGDEIWMRDFGQTGPCYNDAEFLMVNNEVREAYGELPLS